MHCQCESEGWCTTYSRRMTPRMLRICRGEVLTPEKCAAYRADWSAEGGVIACEALPGSVLKSVLCLLKITPDSAGCWRSCDDMIARMNTWGIAGCRKRLDVIVAHLEKAYSKSTWLTAIESAAAGIRNRELRLLALRISPFHPVRSLLTAIVEFAIQQAEASMCDPAHDLPVPTKPSPNSP